jgi:hypothetical protein
MNVSEMNTRADGIRDKGHRLRGRPDPKAWARWRRDMIRLVIAMADWGADAFFSEDRPGDLLNATYAFCYVFGFEVGDAEDGAEGARALAQKLREEPAILRSAVARLRTLLAAAADGGRYELGLETNSRAIFDGSALKAGNSLVTIVKSPTLEQAVTLGAMALLSQEEGAMVRRCARKTCGRIFLAARPKQIFCGRQCASAAVFERYKQKLGEEGYRSKRREVTRRRKLRKRRQTPQRKEK